MEEDKAGDDLLGHIKKVYGTRVVFAKRSGLHQPIVSTLLLRHRPLTKSEEIKSIAAIGRVRYTRFFGKPRYWTTNNQAPVAL
jgi:hypothetical protein